MRKLLIPLVCLAFLPVLHAEDPALVDRKAQIFSFSGEVFVLKEGESEWFPAEKGKILERGDKIWSGKESFVEITLDTDFKNIFRIEKETQAEIRSIEPTDIYIEDGSVYSALEGLPSGDHYQIVTPTAVASVRGTYFYADYESAGKQAQFSLMPHEDDRESRLSIQAQTPEGKGEETLLSEGETAVYQGTSLTPEIQKVSPEQQAGEKTLLEAMRHRAEDYRASQNSAIDLIFIKPVASASSSSE